MAGAEGETDDASGCSRTRPVPPKTVQLFAILVEAGVLVAIGYWIWHLSGGGRLGAAMAVLGPVLVAIVWLTLAAPGLSGRRTQAMLQTPGWLRLALEFGFIALAAYGVWTAGSRAAGETLLTAAGLLVAVSLDSMRWLLRQ